MIDLTALNIEGWHPFSIEVRCNTSGDITRENVESSLKRGLPAITWQAPTGVPALLVGGGPSLLQSLPTIKLGQTHGPIFALNGSARFLNEHGIIPSYQVILDAREKNVDLLGEAVIYLVASQCHPKVFDALEGKRVRVFHLGICEGLVPPEQIIGGCHTVGLTAMNIAHVLGYRELHLFGYDSSYSDGLHAYPQELSEKESALIEVMVEDSEGVFRTFVTNAVMAEQARMFPDVAEVLVDDGSKIIVHGEGLLPTKAKAMRRV